MLDYPTGDFEHQLTNFQNVTGYVIDRNDRDFAYR